MDTFSVDNDAQTQNIISLFGHGPLLPHEELNVLPEEEVLEKEEMKAMGEDLFYPKITCAEVSVETGLFILTDQLNELSQRMKRTSFYLSDLENLII